MWCFQIAKLYFRHGVMNSGKTTQILQIAYDYESNNKNILIAKPKTDTKGDKLITSRLGASRPVDLLIESTGLFKAIESKYCECILIDEVQFLTKDNVLDLVKVVTELDIPVICFGLRSDFLGKPFTGSTWLFALAQDIEEISTRAICECGKRATMNMRLTNGEPVFSGKQVSIDGQDNITYKPTCLHCYEYYRKSYPLN